MNFKSFINESVLSLPKKTLDKRVFDLGISEDPVLKPDIKLQISFDVAQFAKFVPIDKTYIVGSILTNRYDDTSDIDVTMEVDKSSLDELTRSRMMDLLRSLNGKMAGDTQHPINYYLAVIDYGEDISHRFDAIYSVADDRWIKKPAELSIDLEQYISEFESKVAKLDLTTAALRRDLIDYSELKKYDEDQISNIKTMMKSKIFDIEQKIQNLVLSKKEMTQLRRLAMSAPITPEELVKLQSKNLLPVNVVYKLLEKYYYWDFIQKLDDILDNGEFKKSDIPDVSAAVAKFYKEATQPEVEFQYSDYVALNEALKNVLAMPKSPTKKKLVTPGKAHQSQRRRKETAKPQTLSSKAKHTLKLKRKAAYRQAIRDIIDKSDGIYGSDIFNARKELAIAKKQPRGQWWINPIKAKWLARQYHFNLPDKKDPIKHLSNMSIILWRSPKNQFFLVKDDRFKGIS